MKKIITLLLAILFGVVGVGCKGSEEVLPAEKFSDLTNKSVAVIGKGSTPELIFKHLLKGNNLEFIESDGRTEGKVSIIYAADSFAAAALITAGKADYAVIAEPQVSGALKAINREKISFDLQTEYNKINNNGENKGYPQAVLMVKKSVLNLYGGTIKNILTQIEGASEFIKKDIEGAKAKMKEAGATTLNQLTVESVNRSNVGVIEVNKTSLEIYFNIILTSLDAIGGKLPGDEFYFIGNYTEGETSEKLKVFAPDGAPALSVAPLIGAQTVSIIPPQTIASKMQTKEADLIILPSNAAANLFNKGVTDYVCMGATSLGNLYLV